MKEENEIEIYYHWSDLDKEHQYSLVCRFREQNFGNYWVNWLWFKLGQKYPKGLPFTLYPFPTDWTNPKLIRQYKNSNNADKAVLAIQKHFSKLNL